MRIERDLYIKKVKDLLQIEQIKIITGIRRCGKSYMLNLISESLLNDGVDKNHIITISMEDMKFSPLRNADTCHDYIVNKIMDNKKYYVLIDEVQLVSGWEQVVNSIKLRNTSIVLTGSNSQILSGELATLLSGRYVQLQLRTVSFYEYYNCIIKNSNNTDLNKAFNYYLKTGGYPLILSSAYLNSEQVKSIIDDIYTSTVLNDVIFRNQIKDEALLTRLIDYIFDNVGNLFSIRKVVGYLNSTGIKTNIQTISNYIKNLEKAYVIEKASRYDIKGKKLLSSNDKYYVADHSLLYVRRGYSFDYISGILENIIYNDLKRRGYAVFIGKNDDKEVDFIAKKQEEQIYIQVSYTVSNNDTLSREIASLANIKDNFRKIIVTMDSLADGNKNGIEFAYLPEFLLRETL